jgi:hypothetical protein
MWVGCGCGWWDGVGARFVFILYDCCDGFVWHPRPCFEKRGMSSGTLEKERSGVSGLHKEGHKIIKHSHNGRTLVGPQARVSGMCSTYRSSNVCRTHIKHQTLLFWATRGRGECLAMSGCWHQGNICFVCRDCATCADLQPGEVQVENMIHEHGSKLNRFISTPRHILRAGINKLGVVTWDLGTLTWSRGCDLEPGL